MEFRTSFPIADYPHKITHQSRVLTVGSCFSDVIGTAMQQLKIPTVVNPFGTLFNPLAIFKLLDPLYQQPDERLFVANAQGWFHYDFHSKFYGDSQAALQSKLMSCLSEKNTQNTDLLIITFGTAFAYKLQETPTFVANCHKMPAHLFEKTLLSVKDICRGFAQLHQRLTAINPQIQIVLTVSPVRHTKDGIPENQLSKSILRAACHYLETDYSNVRYFPAYEIMLDDLRDYRFYKADMIHPNEVAEAYIFDKFSQQFFSDKLLAFIPRWQHIQKGLMHKAFNPHSEAHQKFLTNLLKQLQQLASSIDVEAEIATITQQLR